ncbi:MAG: hypothetical protein M3Q27_07535 [Actinomycetota bacterium]|nr:hypothetical protein [Actinomycetota bacterium]
MDEFAAALRSRFAAVTAALGDALADGDDYLASVRCGEMESLRRMAEDNGVSLPDVDVPCAREADAVPAQGGCVVTQPAGPSAVHSRS